MNNIYDTDNEVIKKLGVIPGTRFKYIEYKPVGSPYTFSTAHALDGQLPAFEDIKKFVNDLNKVTTENSIDSIDINLNDALYDQEIETDDTIITDTTGENIVMDENGVGDNISYDDIAKEEDAMDNMFNRIGQGTDLMREYYDIELPKLTQEEVQNIKVAFKLGKTITLENLNNAYEKMADTIKDYTQEEFIEELKKRCK